MPRGFGEKGVRNMLLAGMLAAHPVEAAAPTGQTLESTHQATTVEDIDAHDYENKLRIFLDESKTGETVDWQYKGIQFVSEIDVKDPKYKLISCSPAAMFMLVSFLHKENPDLHGSLALPQSLDDVVTAALSHHVRTESGWTQEGWVNLAKQYGVTLERRDYGDPKLHTYAEGEQQLLHDLQSGPAIVSINQGEESRNFHTILVDGFYKEADGTKGFYVYDPIARSVDQPRDLSNPQKRFHRTGHYKTSDYGADFSLEKFWTGRWLAVE